MRRKLLILAIFLAASILAWEFVPLQTMIWDGGFDLTVHIQGPDGGLRSVSCEAFGRREYAEALIELQLPITSGSFPTVANPFDGRPHTVAVAISGRESPFGRDLRWSQFRFLAVTAVTTDGRRVAKIVEIPDGRVSREVFVAFP